MTVRKVLALIGAMFLVACSAAYGQPAAVGGGAAGGSIVSSGTDGNCSPNADQIALYTEIDFKGQCVVLAIGEYPTATSFGLPDDSVSSVRIGANVKAVLCADRDFDGDCEIVTADDTDLSDNATIGDNELSSNRVQQ